MIEMNHAAVTQWLDLDFEFMSLIGLGFMNFALLARRYANQFIQIVDI